MTKQGKIREIYYSVIWYGTTGDCYWSEEHWYTN